MSAPSTNSRSTAKLGEGLLLPGLDGANPLGFLAALGTLQTLSSTNPNSSVSMSWTESSLGWRPSIHGTGTDLASMCRQISNHLKCPFQPDPAAERRREDALKEFDDTRSQLGKVLEGFKKRGLRGKERESAEQTEIEPLRVKWRIVVNPGSERSVNAFLPSNSRWANISTQRTSSFEMQVYGL